MKRGYWSRLKIVARNDTLEVGPSRDISLIITDLDRVRDLLLVIVSRIRKVYWNFVSDKKKVLYIVSSYSRFCFSKFTHYNFMWLKDAALLNSSAYPKSQG
jgi:hypothetical protein